MSTLVLFLVSLQLICLQAFGALDCDSPPDPGNCRGHMPKYNFDPKSHECSLFIYGGCDGNNNNYPSKEACMASCGVERRAARDCEATPEQGPCFGSIARFYYDPSARACKSFTYGGCKGNGNNYKTQIDCQMKCIPLN